MEERDGGVYVQSEVASLTRDIPVVLSWMIKPFVTSIPRETLTATLVATRKAVQSRMANSRTAN
jgi:ABC-type phosphate transport system permease subunit